jgi:hypothetical protein
VLAATGPFDNQLFPYISRGDHYRRIALPSFLINYCGQKRIGKLDFFAKKTPENGSIKQIFQAGTDRRRPEK